jgi:hypothetical protein
MAKHHVMDSSGHSTIEFDKTNKADLDAAMARFVALTGDGHVAAVRKGEADYAIAKSFDPTADETLFVPHLVGG